MVAGSIRLEFSGTPDGFRSAFEALIAETRVRRRVELVFEEIVANIVRHAAPAGAPAQVAVAVDVDDGGITLTFDDDGVPFDPTALAEPVPAKTLDGAPIGGLGVGMVRRLARQVEYRRTGESRNRLVVTLPPSGIASPVR